MRSWLKGALSVRFWIKGDEAGFHIGFVWLALLCLLLAKCGGAI